MVSELTTMTSLPSSSKPQGIKINMEILPPLKLNPKAPQYQMALEQQQQDGKGDTVRASNQRSTIISDDNNNSDNNDEEVVADTPAKLAGGQLQISTRPERHMSPIIHTIPAITAASTEAMPTVEGTLVKTAVTPKAPTRRTSPPTLKENSPLPEHHKTPPKEEDPNQSSELSETSASPDIVVVPNPDDLDITIKPTPSLAVATAKESPGILSSVNVIHERDEEVEEEDDDDEEGAIVKLVANQIKR
jgi:hypothetical protein